MTQEITRAGGLPTKAAAWQAIESVTRELLALQVTDPALREELARRLEIVAAFFRRTNGEAV